MRNLYAATLLASALVVAGCGDKQLDPESFAIADGNAWLAADDDAKQAFAEMWVDSYTGGNAGYELMTAEELKTNLDTYYSRASDEAKGQPIEFMIDPIYEYHTMQVQSQRQGS